MKKTAASGIGAATAAGVNLANRALVDLTIADFKHIIDVNLTGVWRLAKSAVPALLARPQPRHGRFVSEQAHRSRFMHDHRIARDGCAHGCPGIDGGDCPGDGTFADRVESDVKVAAEVAFADNRFIAYTKFDMTRYLDAIRDWVDKGPASDAAETVDVAPEAVERLFLQ